jgi:DNA recombination protein RmuC
MLYFSLGLILGAVVAFLIFREKSKALKDKLNYVEGNLKDTFKALSSDALKSNNEQFMGLASSELEKRQTAIDHIVKPLKESLEKLDGKIHEIEKERKETQGILKKEITNLFTSNENLKKETGNLVTALRKPHVRGRWGEIQLRRVVELAGMQEFCDFELQQTVTNEKDARLRPDMIIKLPSGRQIVVDSKVPLDSYLDAISESDPVAQEAKLKHHAAQVRARIEELHRKEYWNQFEHTPDFVVLFLPGENLFSSALDYDPSLIELGVENKVLVATPTTLIALLKAVAYGWKQQTLEENANKIAQLGAELFERVSTMTEHFNGLGRELNSAVKKYNETLSSMESRVLVSARKFKELGVGGVKDKELPDTETINEVARETRKINL